GRRRRGVVSEASGRTGRAGEAAGGVSPGLHRADLRRAPAAGESGPRVVGRRVPDLGRPARPAFEGGRIRGAGSRGTACGSRRNGKDDDRGVARPRSGAGRGIGRAAAIRSPTLRAGCAAARLGESGYMWRCRMSLGKIDSTKASSLFGEFKAFAFKGNVIDLAVGVIIGAAFGKIVESLVKNVIMPTVGLILPSEQGYAGWKIVVGQKEIPYGLFLAEVVNFLIVAVVLFFFIVKFVSFLMKTKKEELAVVPPLTKDQELLTEIRDLLRKDAAPAAPAAPPAGGA